MSYKLWRHQGEVNYNEEVFFIYFNIFQYKQYSNMVSYHPYPHNPFSLCNYECTNSWSTSFSVQMIYSLPSCVHYIYYVYELDSIWLDITQISLISWLKETLFCTGITGDESRDFKGHRLSDIVIHTLKFTIFKSNSKRGVPAMFWTVEMPTHSVYCCARGQFQR